LRSDVDKTRQRVDVFVVTGDRHRVAVQILVTMREPSLRGWSGKLGGLEEAWRVGSR
jgi:hypothetical protein